MRIQRLTILCLAGILVLSLSGCSLCACPVLSRRVQTAPTPVAEFWETQPTPLASSVIAEADAEERLLINIYKRVSPAVVQVRVVKRLDLGGLELPSVPENPEQSPEDFFQQGTGSGFLIDRDGHIVTNNHVVEDAEEVQVSFSEGSVVRAEIVGTDPDSDVAVIKVDLPAALRNVQPLELGDSGALEIGQRAIAVGNPFGLRGTLTTGIISALGRSLPLGRDSAAIGSRFTIPELIQTDAAINPGNSGGPLLDSQGRVIGINTAYDPQAFGVGFAVPVDTVKRVVPRLIAEGRYPYPWLGISGTDLSLEIVEEMNLPVQRGAVVSEVTPGSPADKAGLKGSSSTVERLGREIGIGGDVIIAIDDQPVLQFEDLLAYIVGHTEVGQSVRLTIVREGRQQQFPVVLAERPQ
jgi:S1-C subfamily serine protease